MFYHEQEFFLTKWKLANDNMCTLCKMQENYEHCFIDCTYFRHFWNFLVEHFKKVGIENNMKKFKYKIRDSKN